MNGPQGTGLASVRGVTFAGKTETGKRLRHNSFSLSRNLNTATYDRVVTVTVAVHP